MIVNALSQSILPIMGNDSAKNGKAFCRKWEKAVNYDPTTISLRAAMIQPWGFSFPEDFA